MLLGYKPTTTFSPCPLQDLRALLLIFSVQPPASLSSLLQESLHFVRNRCLAIQARRSAALAEAHAKDPPPDRPDTGPDTEPEPGPEAQPAPSSSEEDRALEGALSQLSPCCYCCLLLFIFLIPSVYYYCRYYRHGYRLSLSMCKASFKGPLLLLILET